MCLYNLFAAERHKMLYVCSVCVQQHPWLSEERSENFADPIEKSFSFSCDELLNILLSASELEQKEVEEAFGTFLGHLEVQDWHLVVRSVCEVQCKAHQCRRGDSL